MHVGSSITVPIISVIVPVYNVEKYLPRCIDSILAQTFTDFELILVDDGSPDNCGAICDEYAAKDSRVRVIHKANGGVSSARNAGLDAASGEYVTFVDSDDYLPHDFISSGITTCTQKKLDICLFGFDRVDKSGTRETSRIEYELSCNSTCINENDLVELLKKNYISSVWANFFSMKIIADTRFNTSMNFGEDLCFMLSLLEKNARIFASKTCGYYYWVNPDSMTNNINVEKCKSAITTYLRLYSFAERRTSRNGSIFLKFIKKRWLLDYQAMMNQISNASKSKKDKKNMIRILRSNRFLTRQAELQMSRGEKLYHYVYISSFICPIIMKLYFKTRAVYKKIGANYDP